MEIKKAIKSVRYLNFIHIFLFVFVCFFVVKHSAIAQSAQVPDVDNILENAFLTADVPGYSLALVKSGELALSRAGGVINNTSNEMLALNTPLQIGSISKSFTALAIMQLMEEGKVELDAHIEQYLPEFNDTAAGKITLRQALSHTSGYKTIQGNLTQTDFSQDDQALARRVSQLSQISPALPVGEVFNYSNANYQILGRIIETVSGNDYASYIQDKILVPLKMTQSYVLGGDIEVKTATGHLPWFGQHTAIEGLLVGTGSAPQGGIITTAEDLARYAIFMMNQQDDIILAENKRLMMSPVSESVSNYGLGWSIYSPLGLVWHNGSNPGFQAQLSMRPETQDAFVFITNGGNSYGFNEISALTFNLTLDMLALEGPRGGASMVGKIAFILATLLPFVFVYLIVQNWRHRSKLATHGPVRRRLVTFAYILIAIVLSYGLLIQVPAMFGIPLNALSLYVPDWGLLIKSVVFTSIALALFRVGLLLTFQTKQ